MVINMKRDFINYCGLLGIVSFLSYTAAVVFSPLDYPGYNWMAQAVSDLSASNAPSLGLWNQLLQCEYIDMCDDGMCRDTGKRKQNFKAWNLSFYCYGMGICSRI